MPLTDDLLHAWELDEASGNRADSHDEDTVSLTDNNTVTSAAGNVHALAASFAAASSEHLSLADRASVSFGDESFTIEAWVYRATLAAASTIIAKGASFGAAATAEYRIICAADDTLRFQVSNGTTIDSHDNVLLDVAATWFHIVCRHDAALNILTVFLNGSAQGDVGHAGGCRDGSDALHVGATNGASEFWNGRIGPVRIWRRALTSTEVTELYHSGAGLTYAALAPVTPDSSAIDAALISKLAADATLASLLPDGVFYDIAPPGSKRFVIVSLINHDDGSAFGTRAFEDALYLVKAVALSTVSVNMAAAAARIDDLLENGSLTVTGFTRMAIYRERRVRVAESDEDDPSIRWSHRGGFYRVVMST